MKQTTSNLMYKTLAHTFSLMRFKTSPFISIGLAVSMIASCSEKPDVASGEGGDLKVATETKVDFGSSVLDLFPDTGVEPLEASAEVESSCSFSYVPTGSTWRETLDEKDVFFASIKGDGWIMGVGKGGSIYSLRGPYGESIPPQRIESPWNDEVWQTVATNEDLIGPIHEYQAEHRDQYRVTEPLMYFIHQSGIYTPGAKKDGGGKAAAFYSPTLRKRWNPDSKTLELVSWMQQAHTPCVWKSGLLIYTSYRDLGGGILEVNKVLHNFGTEKMNYTNTPWGGIRHSSMPHGIMGKPDGSWEAIEGIYGWTDIPTRNLVDTGGWMAWTQDPKDTASPSLALVFGTDANDVSKGRRVDEAIRWGKAGSGPGSNIRDYQVVERMGHPEIMPGESWSIRWYLVSGSLVDVREHAAKLADKAFMAPLKYENSPVQPVWVDNGLVNTEGRGEKWGGLLAFPEKGAVPVFLLVDKSSDKQVISADIYALAESEPYPNPLPVDHAEYKRYQNRVIYRQYSPHIGYENLLGYAHVKQPETPSAGKIKAPDGVELHPSAKDLWFAE